MDSPCRSTEEADATRAGSPVGILNVDKPKGITSHDVVDAVRRIAGIRQVGHAGTLDPLATGVLVVCVGRATRIAEYLMASRKLYRAGVTTATYDGEGEITGEFPVQQLDRAALESALAHFVGTISQQVPPYSAVKQQGQPLYRRVRRGEQVDPPVRSVEVRRAELLSWEPPVATVEVECGRGTYIRSLAHDWGQAVGAGAYLESLTRLASGVFTLEDAVPLDTLREAAAARCWEYYLLPMDESLLDMEALVVSGEQARALQHGQPIERGMGGENQIARAYTMSGEFIALVRYDKPTGRWAPHKVFAVE